MVVTSCRCSGKIEETHSGFFASKGIVTNHHQHPKHACLAPVIVLLCLSASVLWAADAPARLSLAEAVTTALKSNANLNRAEKDYQTSLSRLKIAGYTTTFGAGARGSVEKAPDESSATTSVFGTAGYEGLGGTQADVEFTPFTSGNELGSFSVSLRQPLVQGRGRLSRKSDEFLSALTSSNVESLQLYLFRQSLTTEVADAYCRAILEQKRVLIQQGSVDIARQASDAAEKKVVAGLIPGLEASRAKLSLARSEDDLNEQRRAARAAVDRLMLAIGSGVGQTPQLTDTEPEAELKTPKLDDLIQGVETPDVSKAVETALANRAELRVATEQIGDLSRGLDIAQDTLRPGLNALLTYDYISANGGLSSGSLFSGGNLVAGLEYTAPLDKRRDRETRDIASRNLSVARTLRDLQIEEIREEVRNAHRALEADRASLKISLDNQAEALHNLDLAQKMVDEGLRDNREILDAKDSLTRLQSSLIAAKINLYLDSLRLKRAMGEDLTKVVSQ